MKERCKLIITFIKKHRFFPGVVIGILIGLLLGFVSWGGKRQSVAETTVANNDLEAELSQNLLENGFMNYIKMGLLEEFLKEKVILNLN